ncbi:MAG: J domain-containing protein [Chlorobi bacterium]|nr:J domain-containing protein [Chlorobiota bacterium]
MKFFGGIDDLNSLTLIYRRLAMLNHPDMGGNAETMKKINIEYQVLKDKLTNHSRSKPGFEINELVLINNSYGRVSHIGEHIIIVNSEVTNRRAIFSKESGKCLSNPNFRLTKIKSADHVGK